MKTHSANTNLITLGGGSFLCIAEIFQDIPGIVSITPGYSGGTFEDCPPFYAKCQDMSGHAEVVQIEYQPEVISFEELVIVFMYNHDPIFFNGNLSDNDKQHYRSIVFYENIKEKAIIDLLFEELSQLYNKPINTEVKKFNRFFETRNFSDMHYQMNRRYKYCGQYPVKNQIKNILSPKKGEIK